MIQKEPHGKRGHKIEERMMRQFKGHKTSWDEVDFETSKCLYEVKSCRLFNRCFNGNDKRDFQKHTHKKIETAQLGRFSIKTDNHIKLYLRALQTGKAAKYIFVLRTSKDCRQIIYCVVDWHRLYVPNNADLHFLPIKKVFYDG